ncbi:hypothetical protein MELB17_03927 [Marinobacter sp. ELB17]|nr:hypothetical protein MELB17_03927 [Marinobacter sp. ELB17]
MIWILGAFYRLFEQVTMPGQAEVEWGRVWRNAQRLVASTNRKNFVVLVDIPARNINYLPRLLPNILSVNHLYKARTKQKIPQQLHRKADPKVGAILQITLNPLD